MWIIKFLVMNYNRLLFVNITYKGTLKPLKLHYKIYALWEMKYLTIGAPLFNSVWCFEWKYPPQAPVCEYLLLSWQNFLGRIRMYSLTEGGMLHCGRVWGFKPLVAFPVSFLLLSLSPSASYLWFKMLPSATPTVTCFYSVIM